MIPKDELNTQAEKLTLNEIVNFAVNNTRLPDANRRILKSTLMGFITALIEQEKEDYLKNIVANLKKPYNQKTQYIEWSAVENILDEMIRR